MDVSVCFLSNHKNILQDFEYAVCLFGGVSDFLLIGKDALQSEFLSSVTIPKLARVLCADL